MRHRPALLLFARAPVPGRTKTRLLPSLGAEGAAELYRCFLLDALAQAAQRAADVIVAVAEPEDGPVLASILADDFPHAELLVQHGGDLGERMLDAFRTALEAGHPAAMIVGTDAPTLPWGRVSEALTLAVEQDVVLGPSLDGGYYLVGMHAAIPRLFEDIAWSTRRVLVETLRRTQELKLKVSFLEPWYDVDTPDDLEALRSHLTALALVGAEMPCPRTWEFLSALPERV